MKIKVSPKNSVVVPGPKKILVPAWMNAKNSFAESAADFVKYLNTATQHGNMTEFQYGVSADDSQDALVAKWTMGGVRPGPTIKYGLPLKEKLLRVCFDDTSQSSVVARAESAKMSPYQIPLGQVIEIAEANGEDPAMISGKRLLELLQEAAGLGSLPKKPAIVITELTSLLNCIGGQSNPVPYDYSGTGFPVIGGKNPGEIFVHGMKTPDNKPWSTGSFEAAIMSKTLGVTQYWNNLSQYVNLEKP
jgi:hypothetical protein